MSVHPVLNIVAPIGTYTAAAASISAWGLHVSDIAVILSSLAAISGVVLQVLIYREQRNTGRRPKASNEETPSEAD
jgi:uncharacterized membrane protein